MVIRSKYQYRWHNYRPHSILDFFNSCLRRRKLSADDGLFSWGRNSISIIKIYTIENISEEFCWFSSISDCIANLSFKRWAIDYPNWRYVVSCAVRHARSLLFRTVSRCGLSFSSSHVRFNSYRPRRPINLSKIILYNRNLGNSRKDRDGD